MADVLTRVGKFSTDITFKALYPDVVNALNNAAHITTTAALLVPEKIIRMRKKERRRD
jgi:hypothetical protein